MFWVSRNHIQWVSSHKIFTNATVRPGGGGPPPPPPLTVSLTVKYQFFLLMPSLMLKIWNCPPHKRCKKALLPKTWGFLILQAHRYWVKQSFYIFESFPQKYSFLNCIFSAHSNLKLVDPKCAHLRRCFHCYSCSTCQVSDPQYKSLKFKFPYKYVSLIVIPAPHTGLQQISFF